SVREHAEDLIDHVINWLTRIDLVRGGMTHHRLVLRQIGEYLAELIGRLAKRIVGTRFKALEHHLATGTHQDDVVEIRVEENLASSAPTINNTSTFSVAINCRTRSTSQC